jgi:hypothetical protein
LHWIRRHIEFHGHQPACEMAESDLQQLLDAIGGRGPCFGVDSESGVVRNPVPAQTCLGTATESPGRSGRAKRPKRLPVVLTRAELFLGR